MTLLQLVAFIALLGIGRWYWRHPSARSAFWVWTLLGLNVGLWLDELVRLLTR